MLDILIFAIMLFCAALLTVDYKGGLFSGLNCQVTKANGHTL